METQFAGVPSQRARFNTARPVRRAGSLWPTAGCRGCCGNTSDMGRVNYASGEIGLSAPIDECPRAGMGTSLSLAVVTMV